MKCSIVKVIIIAVMVALLAGVCVGITLLVLRNNTESFSFPVGFKIGAASASYQIEGGWNEDGKSPNIWDTITNEDPDYIRDKSNGNVAADSYHMYEKDLNALTNIGVRLYLQFVDRVFYFHLSITVRSLSVLNLLVANHSGRLEGEPEGTRILRQAHRWLKCERN